MDKNTLLEKALRNATEDRAFANIAVLDVLEYLKDSKENHKTAGLSLAKYLESLQKSNEQIIKICQMLEVNVEEDENPDDIFDKIKDSKVKKS